MASLIALSIVLSAASAARASCAEWRLWAYEEIPAAFAAGDDVEVLALIDEWREVCGSLPELVRIEVLALIWADRFDEWVVDTRFVDHLAQVELLDREFEKVLADSTLDPLLAGHRFAEFSRELAADVARYTLPGSEEYLLARFYAGDHEALWSRIDVEPYASTLLAQVVAIRREELRRPRPRAFGHFDAGAWDGVGDLSSVGTRATIGGGLGVRIDRFALRVRGELQIGEADDAYVVNDGRQLYLSENFDGAAVDFEPSFRVLALGPVAFELTAGVGWAGVQALESRVFDGFEIPAVWIHTVSRTLGTNLRWDLDRRRFVELQVRRTWLDFDAGAGGSDLDGSAWVVRLGFGLHARPSRDERRAEVIAPRDAPPEP